MYYNEVGNFWSARVICRQAFSWYSYRCWLYSPDYPAIFPNATLDIFTSWRIELPAGVRSHEPLEGYIKQKNVLNYFPGGFHYKGIVIRVESYDSDTQNNQPPQNDNNYDGNQDNQHPPSPQTGDATQALPSLLSFVASIFLLRFWYIKRKEKQ